jgi:hypothetical protein
MLIVARSSPPCLCCLQASARSRAHSSTESVLGDLFAQFAGRFSRVETRRRAAGVCAGLLSPLERKNGWTLAEQAGDVSPNGLLAMLKSPCWDPDAVREDVLD